MIDDVSAILLISPDAAPHLRLLPTPAAHLISRARARAIRFVAGAVFEPLVIDCS